MISVEDALGRLFDLVAPMDTQPVSLAKAAGRVLIKDVVALRDQPPFAASAMDGYALSASEAVPGATFHVIGEAAAGRGFDAEVGAGQAALIFTGAPMPRGADRVVTQEDVSRDGDTITLSDALDKGPHVRAAGADFRIGDHISAPLRLGAAHFALAAAMNVPVLSVARRPVVALISTGDELVMPGEVPGPDQIVASNTFGLKALLEAEGADVRLLPIARDTEDSLRLAFALTKGADLIVTIGGASVGDHDLVGKVAADLGLDRAFWKIAMRPGKPLMAGTVRGVPMIGLPGNPVSSMVLGHLLLRPAMDVMQGLPGAPLPRRKARLGDAIPKNGPREHYMRARLEETDDGLIAFPFPNQDSSLLSVLAAANGLVVHPANAPAMAAGEGIEAIFF